MQCSLLFQEYRLDQVHNLWDPVRNENVTTFIQIILRWQRRALNQERAPHVKAGVLCDSTGNMPMKPVLNTGDCTPQFLCHPWLMRCEWWKRCVPLLGSGSEESLFDLHSLPSLSHLCVGWTERSDWSSHLSSKESSEPRKRTSCVLSHWDMGVVCYCSISLGGNPY